MRCAARPLMVPDVMRFCWRRVDPMVMTFWPAAGSRACPHPSGTGCTAAAAFGSIHRSATPRSASVPTTLAATLTVGDSCTSIAAALPTTRWLVAINPLAPMEKPDPWAVGVQIETTLSCHLACSIADSVSTDDLAAACRRLRPRRSRRSARVPPRGRGRRPASRSRCRACPGTRRADPIRSCSFPAAGGRWSCRRARS